MIKSVSLLLKGVDITEEEIRVRRVSVNDSKNETNRESKTPVMEDKRCIFDLTSLSLSAHGGL